MADPSLGVTKPLGTAVVEELLDEYGAKLRIDGRSKILVSDPAIADLIKERHPGEIGQWQPQIDYTYEIAKPDGSGVLQGHAESPDAATLPKLKDEYYTHVIINVSSETDKESFRIFKWVHWALLPKGVAFWVIPTKDALVSAAAEATGKNVEDVMWWQRSPARLPVIEHVFVKASFEVGKIRMSERDTKIKGKKMEEKVQRAREGLEKQYGKDGEWRAKFEAAVEKEVKEAGGLVQEAYAVMAMKWDQLTG